MDNIDRRQLREFEQITSAERSAGATPELSRESAELREGWLAFAALLDESEKSFDIERLVESVRGELARQSGADVIERQPVRPIAARRHWWISVVAASAVVATVAAGWWWTAGSRRAGVGGTTVATNEQNGSTPAASGGIKTADVTSAAEAWDDTFDAELADTQQRLWQLQARVAPGEVRLESLRQAVDAFDWDLNGSSL